MNYDLLMEEEMKKAPLGASLLLHACCAPCSSAVLERLGSNFTITILYYNPNITIKEEYDHRLGELINFIKQVKTKYPINVLPARYNPKEFFDISKGLEKEKERGVRCYECYNLRLEETARVAKEHNFDYFATTLTLSPYKNVDWLNEIGAIQAEKYQITYLYSDFKKKNGYKRSLELSKIYNLYRQDYCGCIYSKLEREKKKEEKLKQSQNSVNSVLKNIASS